MKPLKVLFILLILLFAFSEPALADDFDWTKDFNIQARANPTGFRASLAARFNLGSVKTQTIISRYDSPADTYIILRLGEISEKPESYVAAQYKQNKGKDWGSLAKRLGIKPGSKEFHALKKDHDLHGGNKYSKIFNVSSDRAMMLMLARNMCKVTLESRTVW